MNDLKDRLRQELGSQDRPNAATLADGALALGRRMRRRRRTLRIVGGTAVTAMAAVGVGFGATRIHPGPSLGPGAVNPVTSASVTMTYVQVPGDWPVPQHPITGPGFVPVTAKAMAARLLSLVPSGERFRRIDAYPTAAALSPPADQTSARYAVWVLPAAEAPVTRANCAVAGIEPGGIVPSISPEPGATCGTTTMTDGSKVWVLHELTDTGGVYSFRAVVTVERPDGITIMAQTYVGDTRTTDGVRQPLSDEELYLLAADPHWGPEADPSYVARAETQLTLGDQP